MEHRKFGLIGLPLSHSFSKNYFTEKFHKENIPNCEYNLYPLENINQLQSLIAETPNLCGLNVTIPYKETVIPLLHELDVTAKAVGAVNCIKVNSSSQQLIGYNTDVFGFKQSIKPFLETQHERALILGTGGAAKAVAYVLKDIGIDYYFVKRSNSLVSKTEQQLNNVFTYQELTEYIINSFKLIINTTPVGMYPNIGNSPEIPYQFISTSHLLYDLVYNPIETEFLKKAKYQGASAVNGLSMLHQQAEAAWRIWNS